MTTLQTSGQAIVSLEAVIDLLAAQQVEIEKLRAALLNTSRRVEALKRECGMDPESAQAIRNGQYMSIALDARAAITKEKAL